MPHMWGATAHEKRVPKVVHINQCILHIWEVKLVCETGIQVLAISCVLNMCIGANKGTSGECIPCQGVEDSCEIVNGEDEMHE